jgi:hypothetical protein
MSERCAFCRAPVPRDAYRHALTWGSGLAVCDATACVDAAGETLGALWDWGARCTFPAKPDDARSLEACTRELAELVAELEAADARREGGNVAVTLWEERRG